MITPLRPSAPAHDPKDFDLKTPPGPPAVSGVNRETPAANHVAEKKPTPIKRPAPKKPAPKPSGSINAVVLVDEHGGRSVFDMGKKEFLHTATAQNGPTDGKAPLKITGSGDTLVISLQRLAYQMLNVGVVEWDPMPTKETPFEVALEKGK